MKFEFQKIEPLPGISIQDWQSWTWQARNSFKSEEDFQRVFTLTKSERAGFHGDLKFQVRASPYYVSVASRDNANDPIRQMILPRHFEQERLGQQIPDPLGEGAHSPHTRLVHRYPDRVLFLVTDQCSLYCRYCLRKHFVGNDQAFMDSKIYNDALAYIRAAKGVREVILSGGDPLTLSDSRLEKVLSDLRQIEHIEIIRIASRMPVVCPMRITDELIQIFKRAKPVFFMTHFNHPQELTHDAAVALERLVDGGVPVLNQMVLLNGINNHPALVQALSRRLVYLRVKPYYMFQCDPSEGTEHFRTSIEDSLWIQRELWGRLSGIALPNLSLDIPGGGGKVGLVPSFQDGVVANTEGSAGAQWDFCGWDGVVGRYEKPERLRIEPDVTKYLDEWNQLKSQRYGAIKGLNSTNL